MSDFFGFGKGRPTNTDESVQEIYQAISAYYPEVAKAIRAEYEPTAAAEVGIAKKYTPELGKLATAELDASGREMSKIGRELSREEQLGAAQTEADILAGPGASSVAKTLELQKSVDPEFFKNREQLMAELDTAFNAMGNDPNALSKGEQEGIARGLGRTNWTNPSPMQGLSNAMTFGDRQAGRRAEYNNLINLRAGTTPALRSGLDVGAIARQRSVTPNFGQQNYLGVQTPGVANANALGSAFTQGVFGTENQTKAGFYGAGKAQKDYTSAFGNLVGGIAGMGG